MNAERILNRSRRCAHFTERAVRYASRRSVLGVPSARTRACSSRSRAYVCTAPPPCATARRTCTTW
jgi:hypothetical protein